MTLTAVVAVLAVHNLVTNLWAPEWSYVPVNLATAAGLVALAGAAGVAVGGPRAAATAAASAATVAGAVAVVAVVRPRLLADRRMAGVGPGATAWRALVRIPLGTVVLEEVAFRGVLPALSSPVVASALFGLWHVVPTARTLAVNGVAPSPGMVAAAVVVTAAAGLVLCGLRAATGGLLAPAALHAAANGSSVVAAYAVLSRRGAGRAAG